MSDARLSSSLEPMNTKLFVELMKHFFDRGWMCGSGGAMGFRNDINNSLIISPSALQKDRLLESDLFVYNMSTGELISKPQVASIQVSSCYDLFNHILSSTGAACVIHTHSLSANLITQLEKSNTFQISHQEYIKGIRDPCTRDHLSNEHTLIIPIIENKPSERQLLPGLQTAMNEHPQTVAVLVKNHGLFVWGYSWTEAKIQLECIEYLLELAVSMIRLGLPLVRKEEAPIVRFKNDNS